MPIYYNLSNEARSAMMTAISYGASDMLSGFDAVWNGVPLYDDVIGDWCSLSQNSRNSYLNQFWSALMCTKYPLTGKAAVDYLTSDQQTSLRSVWNVLMDVVLRFVSGDYKNNITDWGSSETPVGKKVVDITEHYADSYKNYGKHSLVVLGTILYNTDSISQGHYPEINFAWLRSYDSFYKKDGNKPITVVTDKTPSVKVDVVDDVMTLTTDVKGAGIFYRLSKNATTYGNWIPYNRAVSLADYKYVQTTAIYCGEYCPVKTTDLFLTAKHTVTVNDTEVGKYAVGSTVTVDGSDGEKVFKSWNTLDGITKEEDLNNAVLTFTMPAENVALTANYVTRITAVKLTVDAPVAGANLPTTGILSWTVNGAEKEARVGVYWLEQIDVDGKKQTQLATGTAGYATKYSVAAIISQKPQKDLAFSADITATVVYGDKESTAYQAETDAAGALLIYGNQISTGKVEIDKIPELTVAIAQGSSEATLKEKLPEKVTVTLADGNDTKATLELDWNDVDISGVLAEGGVLCPAIKETDTVEASHKSVRVNITISEIAAPDFDTTKDANGNVIVTMTAEAGTTIKFKLNNDTTAYDYDDYNETGYTLKPVPGTKRTYVITAWTEKGDERSSDAVFTYTFDNPYTVTVNLEDTAGNLPGWKAIETYTYYEGDKVTIAAPVEDGELFYQWKGKPEDASGELTDNSLTIDSISGDITVTAIYTPVIKSLDISMEEPKAIKKLAENIDDASFTITNTYTLSKLLESSGSSLDGMVGVIWIPAGKTAGYATAYTAKITVKSDIMFFLADNIKISVNDNKAIRTSTAFENGSNVIYVTFPATDMAVLRSVAQPETLIVRETQAKSGNWSLPQAAAITYSDGSTEQRTITWKAPNYVANQLTYTATGTVNLADVNNPDKVSGNVEVKIIVTPEEVTKPVAPTADLISGTYEGTQYVRLSCTDEDAVIYYTTDGKDPAASGTRYQAGASIKIASPTTLKAIAVKDDRTSDMATYTYTITAVTPNPTPSTKPTPSTTVTPDGSYQKCPQDNTCPIAAFTDSNPKAWYHDGVHFCLDEGLMNGVSETGFAPNEIMTRAQLVTILWRLEGEERMNYSITFKDVSSGTWYTEAVRWAAAEGIVEGYSEETFGTNDAITREQLAAILWRYAKYKGMDVSAEENVRLADYMDQEDISSYAVSAIAWAVSEGIITGTGFNTLSPRATATRAQTACMIQRFDQ